MKDLTQGSIIRQLLTMAGPIVAGMIFQTLYYLVDLYFVAALGDAAVAGVSAAGNAMFLVLALTQVLGVATVALVSQAVGRKDHQDANLIFNQALLMAGACGLATIVGGYALAHAYVQSVAADPATSLAGVTYLYWFIPGMALQFALVALGSALRGTGIVKPTMVVQMVTVVLNVVLAPILIAGWGTGHAMGVAGAGLASSLAIAVAVGMLWWYFQKLEKFVHFDRTLFKPRSTAWARILHVGLPAGGEFALMFVFMGVIYWAIRDFGPQAQAGFGIGSRVMQAIFLPAMAIAFAAGPIAGQNFGAKRFDRVRETFAKAALLSSVVMALLTVFAHWRPDILVRGFTTEPEVVAIGVRYLQVMSWNFVAQGLIFTCSSMFQGLGNTQPAMLSMASRLPTFVLPIIWLSSQPNFSLEIVWYVSVASVAVQAVVSLVLLYRQFRARLPAQSAAVTA